MNIWFICAVVFALGLGLFILLKPLAAFEIQKRFYRLINWNIEPVSLQKEIRNTRLMGGFLIAFVLAVFAYRLIKGG